MVDLSKVVKLAGKFAVPLFTGSMAVISALEEQKQKDTIAKLVAKVAELESKVK